MAEAHDTYGIIFQNLLDAGCDTDTTKRCMEFAEAKQYGDILPLLSQHREHLLGAVHKSQRQIDCLDHLVYRIKNKKI